MNARVRHEHFTRGTALDELLGSQRIGPGERYLEATVWEKKRGDGATIGAATSGFPVAPAGGEHGTRVAVVGSMRSSVCWMVSAALLVASACTFQPRGLDPSDPEAEQMECVYKARALFRAADEAVRFAEAARRGNR